MPTIVACSQISWSQVIFYDGEKSSHVRQYKDRELAYREAFNRGATGITFTKTLAKVK